MTVCRWCDTYETEHTGADLERCRKRLEEHNRSPAALRALSAHYNYHPDYNPSGRR